MGDFETGVKRDVAEIKFLIHDLRVERCIDEVIHFHVALDADLEIYGIEGGGIAADDLKALRGKAVASRRSFERYCDAVVGLADQEVILDAGNRYIDSIHDLCSLVLERLWQPIDGALTLLPPESLSVRSRNHYRNTVRWLCGVYYRIEHFWAERRNEDVHEVFDVAADLDDYTRNVVQGYVTERSAGRAELRLEDLEPAVLGGNRHRFRRMFFNLVMNAVDAIEGQNVGAITVRVRVEGAHLVLTVQDDGAGMSAEKVDRFLSDRSTLDGELHFLGCVFVRRTVAELGGEISIDSTPGAGTTVAVAVPRLVGVAVPPRPASLCAQFDLPSHAEHRHRVDDGPAESGTAKQDSAGQLVVSDYERSEADHPGCIFAIAVADDGRLELFAHRPYERLWNMGHEDLLPALFEAAIRGRLEDDDDGRPMLVLKEPQSAAEFFDFKRVPPARRTGALFRRSVRDEYIRAARLLVSTGIPGGLPVHLTGADRFFSDQPGFAEGAPIRTDALAALPLTGEAGT